MHSKTVSNLLKVFAFSGVSSIAIYSLMGLTSPEGAKASDSNVTIQQGSSQYASQIEARGQVAKLLGSNIKSNRLSEK